MESAGRVLAQLKSGLGLADRGRTEHPLPFAQMSKRSAVKPRSEAGSDAEIVSEFQRGMVEWGTAIDAHKMAPPDAGFAARLAALARGAHEAAQACLQAGVAGFEWPSARKEDSAPPYELRPETG